MNPVIHRTIYEGIKFTYIPENKFKTALISFSMFTPLSLQTVSENALISGLLTHSCKKFPSLYDISVQLEELYGSCVFSSVSKSGDSQVITFSAMGLSSAFAFENPNNTLDLTKILCEMIFNPDIENNHFKEENFKQCQRQLIEDIQSEMNDKRIYAKHRAETIMCEDEKYKINALGDISSAENLNSEQTYSAWKKLLSSSHIEITIAGNVDSYEPIISEFKNRFSEIKRENISDCTTKIVPKATHIKEISETMSVSQCKLVMGFRTKTATPQSTVPAVILMNALFGGTARSKLFLNVREKLSLCYYCSSRYNKNKGILLVESGTEEQNVQKAKKEITEQLKDIKLGNFSDTDLAETKLFLAQEIKSTADSLNALSSWYISQVFYKNKKSPKELIDEINSVSREEVMEAANNLTLDTVYTLCGNKEEK